VGRGGILTAAQRNNITELSPELRQLASRLLYDAGGRHYERIRTALREAGADCRIHNSTLLAWQKGPEYRRYRDAREKVDNAQIRATAQALNDGEGPRDHADVAVFEVVRELASRMQSGEISELADLAKVTQALAPLLRAQIAADHAALRRRVRDLETQLAAADAAHELAMAKVQEELSEARSGKAVDPAAEAERVKEIRQRLGVA
jgi:hypothetical protein